MNCKEFEKLIPLFIDRKMDFRMLKRFGEHMDCCPKCKEELDIQFLVKEGMQRLEEGDAFDLQNELEQRVAEAKRKVKMNYRFMRMGENLEILLVILIAVAIVWMII